MRERAVTDKILPYLHKLPNSWWMKVNDRSTAGIPDIIGSIMLHNSATDTWHRYPVGIEVKRPGAKARPLQDAVMQRMRDGGYLTATVHSLDEVDTFLRENFLVK